MERVVTVRGRPNRSRAARNVADQRTGTRDEDLSPRALGQAHVSSEPSGLTRQRLLRGRHKGHARSDGDLDLILDGDDHVSLGDRVEGGGHDRQSDALQLRHELLVTERPA